MEQKLTTFYHNGKLIKSCSHLFTGNAGPTSSSSGYFAAASFMSFQQCLFNFGSTPFKFPPTSTKHDFKAFNDQAHLSPEDKVILPKHLLLEMLSKHTVNDDACTLCFDAKAW